MEVLDQEKLRSPIDGKFHYLYKITNNINDRYYYGVHSTSILEDNYMGSGSIIKKAISKYGVENFTKEIISFFGTREELLLAENRIVTPDLINDPKSYNLAEGGKQGSNHVVIAKDKLGEVVAVSDRDPKWLSGELVGVTKGYILCKDSSGNKKQILASDPKWLSGELVGVTKGYGTFRDINGNIVHTKLDDYRIKNGELVGLTTGRKHIYKDGIEKLVNSVEVEEFLSQGWKLGSPSSSRTKGKIIVNNGFVNKIIKVEELNIYLGNGWQKGSRTKTPKGQINIHKDEIIKRIWPTELDAYIRNGWKPGMGPRRHK